MLCLAEIIPQSDRTQRQRPVVHPIFAGANLIDGTTQATQSEMPVETRTSNVLLPAIAFGRLGQFSGQCISAGKRVMALDNGDASAGSQPSVVFSQVSFGGSLLELPQVGCGQRQAQASIAHERHVVSSKHNGSERNIGATMLVLRQSELD